MRCKMCGAQLKKDGDICKNCYEKYQKQENMRNTKEQELLKIKRKYSPKFNLLKNGEIIVFVLIFILAGFATYSTPIAILLMMIGLLFFGAWMFYNKRRASGTTTTFYETKFRYKAKYGFVNRDEMVAYDEIKDMAYFQTRSQKICKVGDIRFYTKGFLNGITIHDIPEIEENFEKIKNIINESRGGKDE